MHGPCQHWCLGHPFAASLLLSPGVRCPGAVREAGGGWRCLSCPPALLQATLYLKVHWQIAHLILIQRSSRLENRGERGLLSSVPCWNVLTPETGKSSPSGGGIKIGNLFLFQVLGKTKPNQKRQQEYLLLLLSVRLGVQSRGGQGPALVPRLSARKWVFVVAES